MVIDDVTRVDDDEWVILGRDYFEPRVQAGIDKLNQGYGPHWIDRIDLDYLNIASFTLCVLGQVYGGSYGRGVIELGISDSIAHGFYVPVSHKMPGEHLARPVKFPSSNEFANQLWREKITELRAARTSAA